MAAAAEDKQQSKFVIFSTALGQITVELCWQDAPQTCAAISNIVKSGAYNGCCFYRAEPNFVVQGGLKKVDGSAAVNPNQSKIPLEFKRLNTKGTVTLARWEDTDSGTSEFFINLKDNPHLDKTGDTGWALGFAVWGVVVEGFDVAAKISTYPTKVKGGLKMLVEPIEFQAALSD